MGVAHKMSADERSGEPVVISIAKLAKIKRGKVKRENANDESAENERTPSPDDPVFNPEADPVFNPGDMKEEIDCVGAILNAENSQIDNEENPALLDQSLVKEEEGPGSVHDSQDGSRTFEGLDSFPESKRKRGRPAKKLEPVPISLDESRQSLNESENFEETNPPNEGDSEIPTKRTRTRPKRFVPDEEGSPKTSKRVQDETSSDSSLVPAKKRRGRPPKSDVSGTPTIVPPSSTSSDVIKDPIEEDLSASSSDVAWFVSSESKLTIQTETSACPSPAASSASSSSESPLRLTGPSSQKRQRGRPRLNHVGERMTAIANFAQVRDLCKKKYTNNILLDILLSAIHINGKTGIFEKANEVRFFHLFCF
jgi:hypothetical protein